MATRPVDFRKGADAMAAMMTADYDNDAFFGSIYVFQAERAVRSKLIWWAGTALCLMTKRPEL